MDLTGSELKVLILDANPGELVLRAEPFVAHGFEQYMSRLPLSLQPNV